MANSYFHFKQFTVHQDQCAMKVGTDGVVLGALAGAKTPKTILDIGTGTGVLSMMLAQRFENAVITAVETDQMACQQAKDNISGSAFRNRIDVLHTTFQQYAEQVPVPEFDLIISNPPYYTRHLKSGKTQKDLAMHNDQLPFGELIRGVVKCLDKAGEFWVILPPAEMQNLEKLALFFEMYPNDRILLSDRNDSKVIRCIQSFTLQKREPVVRKIWLKEGEVFSEQYRQLLKAFLTIF